MDLSNPFDTFMKYLSGVLLASMAGVLANVGLSMEEVATLASDPSSADYGAIGNYIFAFGAEMQKTVILPVVEGPVTDLVGGLVEGYETYGPQMIEAQGGNPIRNHFGN